jgi:hypothetical protein
MLWWRMPIPFESLLIGGFNFIRIRNSIEMLWRRRPTLHYTCFRGGCPNSIRILIDFYLKFNRKCFGGGWPHRIRILIDFNLNSTNNSIEHPVAEDAHIPSESLLIGLIRILIDWRPQFHYNHSFFY